MVAGVLIVGVLCAERFAVAAWKPSSMIGSFTGNEEASRILTSIEAKRAEVAMQQQEQSRAQQEVVAAQAQNERVTKAYEALYQRGNMMAQQWADGVKQALVMETQSRIQALKGRSGVSNVKDNMAMWCDLGKVFSPDITCGDDLRASARDDRDAMTGEIVANFKAQSAVIASSLKDWSQGLPDPAGVVAAKAKFDHLYPAAREATPSAPIYTATQAPTSAPVQAPPQALTQPPIYQSAQAPN